MTRRRSVLVGAVAVCVVALAVLAMSSGDKGEAPAAQEGADADAGMEIVHVATAFEESLDPTSPDDPCRYLTAAARAEVVADPSSDSPAGSCKTIIRFYEHRSGRGARPNDLGAATVELGAPVRVPAAPGGFGPSQVEGAEVRFANVVRRSPVSLVMEHRRWQVASYR
jgi:hypothetical protein